MLRNRLLAATAAFALASAQVSSGYAALPSPSVQTPAANDNSALAANTSFVAAAVANLKTYVLALLQQNYTLQVPSAAALRTTAVFTGVMAHRTGYATAGDGGAADYAGSTASCLSGDDGGTCLNAPGGSWRIDAAALISPELFSSFSTTDATAAFQAAANARCNGTPVGGKVMLAAKTYNFSGTSSISYSCSVQWEGAGWSESPMTSGTWLHVASTGSTANGGASLFSLTNPGARGTTWSRFGVAQDQPTPASGWAATAYPVVFKLSGLAGGARFRDIMAGPVYDLISSINSGRTDFCGVYGQVLHTGIFIDASYDTTHGSCGAIHFWPFWSADSNVMQATQTNGSSFLTLGRVDGLVLPDVFGLGFNYGVKFVQSSVQPPTAGAWASKINFGSFYSDATAIAVYAEGVYAEAPYYYPYSVHFNSLDVSCSGLGSNVAANSLAAPNSFPVLVNGAIDLQIDAVNSENCSGALVNLPNTQFGSQIRIGAARVHNSAASLINAPTVTQVGATQHDISIGTRPIMDGSITQLFSPANSQAIVDIPLQRSVPLAVTASTSYPWPGYAENITLGSANTSVAGVTIQLPPNPFPGQVASITTTSQMTSFSVTSSAYGIQPTPPTNTQLNAYSTFRFRYVVPGNTWATF